MRNKLLNAARVHPLGYGLTYLPHQSQKLSERQEDDQTLLHHLQSGKIKNKNLTLNFDTKDTKQHNIVTKEINHSFMISVNNISSGFGRGAWTLFKLVIKHIR